LEIDAINYPVTSHSEAVNPDHAILQGLAEPERVLKKVIDNLFKKPSGICQ
jgi:hypothetical protein